jgi:glucose/arabinose dehydrogenase
MKFAPSRKWLIWITLLVLLGLAGGAYVAGGIAQKLDYWPFGGRYALLEKVFARAEKVSTDVAASMDTYSKREIETNQYEIQVESYLLPFDDDGPTGPLEVISDKEFLVATRLGALYHVQLAKDAVKTRELGSFGVFQQMPLLGGVKDLLLLGPNKLLVSMNTYDEPKGCYALGLFEYSFNLERPELKQVRKVFESQPCVSPTLGLHVSGGRIVRMSDDAVLLSIGDFEKGYLSGRDTNYGRVLQIRLKDGTAKPFATGTRNAQGLFLDKDTGMVFETEHGPRGGDEVNVLREGKNYGWPYVNYGTPYGKPDVTETLGTSDTQFGDHTGFELPLYVFVPSIGVSEVIRYPLAGREFHRWQGDLLVASLAAQTLYRLKFVDGRILFSEPIALGERLRDLQLMANGSIAAKTDSQRLLIISRPHTAARG